MTLRPLGVGSQILAHGDIVAGFYGEVTGIITADELRALAGVTQGTAMQTGDITWLKFSSNYKTLYIAKQPIQHSISWDYLHERDLVFGKMIEIGNYVYLLRLMQGANISPANTSGGYNNEWDNLIVKSHTTGEWGLYSDADLNVNPIRTIVQEVSSQSTEQRIMRGYTISHFGRGGSSDSFNYVAWRPVLELLYEK
ncbi:hypothetical protein CIW83_18490 [Tissierella sp. P1]|uniref:hypothetical protein n=1 Tax=Tissierella sp. P1 TaxID=1280483 RepID=UPI000BA106BE|nr:hypothetical protein [Tissierella sp. P1]OZV10807.1 hypothetical protein CIW83_18490 [Tissierella sp. P1]